MTQLFQQNQKKISLEIFGFISDEPFVLLGCILLLVNYLNRMPHFKIAVYNQFLINLLFVFLVKKHICYCFLGPYTTPNFRLYAKECRSN